MSVQTTFLQSQLWIHHDLYNQFPNVEDARNSISEKHQIAIGEMLAISIPKLIGKFGTTLTHSHHAIKQSESISGYADNGRFLSKPKERTDTACPITWVAVPQELLATEAMDNASPEVFKLAKKVEKYASKILQNLPLEPNERFSKLSITIDPRILFHTDDTYFLETNDKDRSILTAQEKKESQCSERRAIPTYKSINSPQSNGEGSRTWCSYDCLTYGGKHYYSHIKK